MAKFLSDSAKESYINKLVNNPNLNPIMNKIIDLESMDANTLSGMLTSNLTKEQFDNSVKQMAKSLKLALKTPNQYLSDIPVEYTTKINGKYPALSDDVLAEYQNEVVEFFKKNSDKMLKTYKSVDNDTFNQLMDRRFSLFQGSIDDLSELTEENSKLLSKLINCKNINSKDKLDPKN